MMMNTEINMSPRWPINRRINQLGALRRVQLRRKSQFKSKGLQSNPEPGAEEVLLRMFLTISYFKNDQHLEAVRPQLPTINLTVGCF
jgi:hypothetical protein